LIQEIWCAPAGAPCTATTSQRQGAHERAPLQQETGGADDLALLRCRHRSQRAAIIAALPLAHFDDGQHLAVAAYQVEFTGFATQVARDDLQAVPLQVLGRHAFARCTA